jgi:hypothetical protein
MENREEMMTFEQFQSTRRYCDDLGEALDDATWEHEAFKARGNLYLDVLYIEEVNPGWSDQARAKGREPHRSCISSPVGDGRDIVLALAKRGPPPPIPVMEEQIHD